MWFCKTQWIESLQLKKHFSLIYVQPDADIFKEHFRDDPILPGAMSLDLCLNLIQEYLLQIKKINTKLISIKKINFQKIIKPKDDIYLTVNRVETKNSISSVIFNLVNSENSSVLSGVIDYEEISYE